MFYTPFFVFLQVAVKEAVVTLFEPINKLLDGEAPTKPTAPVEYDCSLKSIMESFAQIKSSLANMEIPDEVMEELKREFLNTNIDGKLYVKDSSSLSETDENKKEAKKKFKLPKEKLLPPALSSTSTGLLYFASSNGLKSVSSDNSSSTGLKLVSSDRSSSTGLKSTSSGSSTCQKSTSSRKPVTMFTCPLQPCRFTLTKAEMREGSRPTEHLTEFHKITSLEGGSDKFKFGKIKLD